MRVLAIAVLALALVQTDAQFWKYSQQFFDSFNWLRQGKNAVEEKAPPRLVPTQIPITEAAAVAASTATQKQQTTRGEETTTEPRTTPAKVRETKTTIKEITTTKAPSPVPTEMKVIVTEKPLPTTVNTVITAVNATEVQGSTTAPPKTAATTNDFTLEPRDAEFDLPTTTLKKQAATAEPKITAGVKVDSTARANERSTKRAKQRSTTPIASATKSPSTKRSTTAKPTTAYKNASVDATTTLDTTITPETAGTTEEPRDNHHRVPDFYLKRPEKPEVKTASNISQVSGKKL